MIQPLRTAHRRVFIVLAALLPAIIAGGLTARRHNPTSASSALRIHNPTFIRVATYAVATHTSSEVLALAGLITMEAVAMRLMVQLRQAMTMTPSPIALRPTETHST